LIVSFDTIISIKPPYHLTPKILDLCLEIERLVGRYEGLRIPKPQPMLRRRNRIRSIQSSLAIEGNPLSYEQVAAIIDQKWVAGPKRDILEVQNAVAAYDEAARFNVFSEKSFLKAHAVLMKGLVPDAGRWRTGGMSVREGDRVVHVAPGAAMVPRLMSELFRFLKEEKGTSPLVLSCVFHYEVEFIHPFSDGNGRIGRLWQHAMLMKRYPFFEFIPIESLIRKSQKEYYAALKASDRSGNSNVFIEFCLTALREAVEEFIGEVRPEPLTAESRLKMTKEHFAKDPFSRKDYLRFHKSLSTATASRDLQRGVENGLLTRSGEKAMATYRFV
jgi:Fic family protein